MKKSIMKAFMAGCVIALGLGLGNSAYAADDVASTDVHLIINGQVADVNPEIGRPYINKDGRTMLPLRYIGEASGAKVYQASQRVYMENPLADFSAWLDVDSPRFVVNHQEHYMDVPPVVSEQWRAYLPARAMAETFGTVDWDAATRTVTITGNLQEKRTHTQYPVSDTLFYQLAHGISLESRSDIYLERQNPAERIGSLLSFPADKAAYYKGLGVDDLLLKSIRQMDNGSLIAVESSMSRLKTNVMDVYFDDHTSGNLVYAGLVVRTSDYASDGTCLFSTDGVFPDGPGGVDGKKIFVQKIGDHEKYAYFDLDLDFDINECTLEVKDGKLLATDPKGTVHSLDTAELIKKAGLNS